MTQKKIFLVLAEPKLHDARLSPINWFPTEDEAYAWIDRHGNKKNFWFEVQEVESSDGP